MIDFTTIRKSIESLVGSLNRFKIGATSIAVDHRLLALP